MWTGGFPADLGGMAKYAPSTAVKKVTAYVVKRPGRARGGSGGRRAAVQGGPASGFTIEPVPSASPTPRRR